MTFFALSIWAQRDKSVGFTCGRSSPTYTDEVINMAEFYKAEQYDIIRSYLHKGKAERQYLALLLLERSAEKQLIDFSEEDLLQIEKLKSSKKKVKICGGCTGYWEVPMKYLFSEEYKNEKEKEKYGHLNYWKINAENWATLLVMKNYHRAIQ